MKHLEDQFRQEVLIKTGRLFAALIFITLTFRHLIVTVKPIPFAITTLIALVLVSFSLWPKKYLSVKVGSTFFLSALSILGFLAGLTNGGVRAPGVIILILCPLFGIFTGGTRGAILGCCFAFISITALVIFEYKGLVFPMQRPDLLHYYLPIVLIMVAVASLAIGIVYENYRKKSEQRIIDISVKAQQASRMAAVGEMAAGIAHEINNPLSIITLNAELLVQIMKQPDVDREKVISKLQTISKTTFRAAEIIEGLRTFARDAEDDSFHSIHLDHLVFNVLEMCRTRFERSGIEIRIADIPDAKIQCRSAQISQTMLILLSNSFDAIKEQTEKWISIEVKLNNQNLVNFYFTDSGSGVPIHMRDKIMQPFFTTKPAGKGSGLGLSIAQGIIESHQGKIGIDETHPNTRFVFQLPLSQA